MEAEVIRKALFLMWSEKRTDYITLDMTLSGMPEEDVNGMRRQDTCVSGNNSVMFRPNLLSVSPAGYSGDRFVILC